MKDQHGGWPASFGRCPTVQVAVRPGRPLQVERLDLDRGEGLGGDQALHVPVQVTAVGEAHLQPVQAALPLLDARHLRSQPDFAGAVLVALTGYGRDEDRRQAQAAGFNHHMVKPVNFDALQELLSALEPHDARRL